MEIYTALDNMVTITNITEYNIIDLLLMVYSFFKFFYSVGFICLYRAEMRLL